MVTAHCMETRKRALPRGGKQRCRDFTTKNPNAFERTVSFKTFKIKKKKAPYFYLEDRT